MPLALGCSRLLVSEDDRKSERAKSGISCERDRPLFLYQTRSSPARFFNRRHWQRAWNRLPLLRSTWIRRWSSHVLFFIIISQNSPTGLLSPGRLFRTAQLLSFKNKFPFYLQITNHTQSCQQQLKFNFKKTGHQTLVAPLHIKLLIVPSVNWRTVHMYPDTRSATFSFRIRLPSARIRRIWQRIRIFSNPMT